MRKTLLKATKIGGFLGVGCQMIPEEVGLFIVSALVSAGCGFKVDERDNFVETANEAGEGYGEIRK